MQTSLLTTYHSQANCIYATANKIVELNMSLVYCVVQSSFYDLQSVIPVAQDVILVARDGLKTVSTFVSWPKFLSDFKNQW